MNFQKTHILQKNDENVIVPKSVLSESGLIQLLSLCYACSSWALSTESSKISSGVVI